VLPWILLTAAALAGLLVAERRGSRWGICVCKPLASLGFLGAAVAAGASGSLYGRAVLAALVLSWIGDVLLMSSRSAVFLAGLGAFLLAHVAFGAAFWLRGEAWPWTAGALALLILPAGIVSRWLRPHLPAEMRVPVHAYIAVITGMLALAAGTAAAGSPESFWPERSPSTSRTCRSPTTASSVPGSSTGSGDSRSTTRRSSAWRRASARPGSLQGNRK
jgi:uncharacterized membrane protein YhhN